jgi:hypothetical protein
MDIATRLLYGHVHYYGTVAWESDSKFISHEFKISTQSPAGWSMLIKATAKPITIIQKLEIELKP